MCLQILTNICSFITSPIDAQLHAAMIFTDPRKEQYNQALSKSYPD